MGIVNLKTNLRTLRYSNSGFANQPYIKTSLLKDFKKETGAVISVLGGNRGLNQKGPLQRIFPGSPDFLLRDNSVQASLNDVSRLSQYMIDFKAGGPLFIAKQNLLSLANVNVGAGYSPPVSIDSSNISIGNGGRIGTALSSAANNIVDFIKTNVSPNQGIYSPLGTIAQAGVSAAGFHLNRQGLKPFSLTDSKNDTPGFPTYLNTIGGLGIEGPKTRMQGLFTKQLSSPNPSNTNLISYTGGPGATLGVGRTIIKVAPGQPSGRGSSVFLTFNDPRYNSGNGNSVTNRFVLTQQEISEKLPVSQGGEFENFAANLISEDIPKSLDYKTKNIEQRVNLGDPGKRGDISSYTIGKREPSSTATTAKANSRYENALDKITAFPLYQSQYPIQGENKKLINDLVKFRIGVIDNDNPSLKTYIHFRAIIDSMNDSYTSNWEAQRFMGRGENFYKYDGFDRSISLSWTVAAQSKQELIPMYQKLNYLASVCAPDYSSNGYMRGNLISLTIGGYCYEQVGIMKGITLDVPTESPWEIGINDSGKLGAEGDSVSDPSVKELPMIIKVTGFTFVPIHNFVPQLQQNIYRGSREFISNYGPERYIGLNVGGTDGNNYDGKEGNLNYIPSVNFTPPPRKELATSTPNFNRVISPVNVGG